MSLHCILFLHCLGSLAGIISLKKEFLQELWGGALWTWTHRPLPGGGGVHNFGFGSNELLGVLLAEVDAIAKLALTAEQLQSMAISVAISCLSAGLSFAGRDKSDGIVLSLPGKVGWGPTMGCLVLVRAMEVASRMVAFNIIQVSMRGGWCGHVGAPWPCLFSWSHLGSAFQRQSLWTFSCLGFVGKVADILIDVLGNFWSVEVAVCQTRYFSFRTAMNQTNNYECDECLCKSMIKVIKEWIAGHHDPWQDCPL